MKYSPDKYEERNSPTKVRLEFKDNTSETDEQMNGKNTRPTSTNWASEHNRNSWFTEPAHISLDGSRRSRDLESSAIEDYLQSIDKLENLRSNIHSLRNDLELSSRSIDDRLGESRRSAREDLELSRSYRMAADDLDSVRDDVLDVQAWSEAAPRPRLSCSATPYREQINTLRLKSLRLEEKRLLEIRRLQELERIRGPKPKWYELKTPQFCVEAKKNNEILAAKKQWGSLRDYTETVWKSKDLSRSAPDL